MSQRRTLNLIFFGLFCCYLALGLAYLKDRAESQVDPQGLPGLLFGKHKPSEK